MAELLLSSLCRICHTNQPKYRCPRCSAHTCSLACNKRHKLWSECSGVRDPTVYKPCRELATPAGIDHDYNFISNIERGIERTNKLILEEKGLVDRNELLRAKGFLGANRNGRLARGDIGGLRKALEESKVIVDRAPKGLQRNRENSTNWSRHQKCINWQVEWVRDDGSRVLGKVLENHPIGKAYAILLEEQRRASMTEGEKKREKKRKAEVIKVIKAKRAKITFDPDLFMRRSALQNPESSAWDQGIVAKSEGTELNTSLETDTEPTRPSSSSSCEAYSGLYFYLRRPNKLSPQLDVLIPLDPSKNLSTLLQNRVVLEFPTICAIRSPPTSLPCNFILENDCLLKRQFDTSRHSAMSEDDDIEEGEVV